MEQTEKPFIPTERDKAICWFLSRVGPATTGQVEKRFSFKSKAAAYRILHKLESVSFLRSDYYFRRGLNIKERYWHLASSGQAGKQPMVVDFLPELRSIRKDSVTFQGLRPAIHDHEFKCVDVMLKFELDLKKAEQYGHRTELVDIIGLNQFRITTAETEQGVKLSLYPDRVAVILFDEEIRFIFFELDMNGNEALWARDKDDILRGNFGKKITVYRHFKHVLMEHPKIQAYLNVYQDYKKTALFGQVVTICYFDSQEAGLKELRRLQYLKRYTEGQGQTAFFTFGSAQEILKPDKNMCFDSLWYRAGREGQRALLELPE